MCGTVKITDLRKLINEEVCGAAGSSCKSVESLEIERIMATRLGSSHRYYVMRNKGILYGRPVAYRTNEFTEASKREKPSERSGR